MKTAGILLIVIGVLAFLYGGFSYVQDSRVVDAGPLQVTWRRQVPVPPLVGVAAVIGAGVVLVSLGSRRRTA